MKKRVYIVHGWEGTPFSNWFPWLKRELEQKGFEVFVPQLPSPVNPDLDSWISYLKQYVNNPNENTIFVGHSLGCITILRFIETLDTKVGAVVLVAGFGKDLDYEGYKGEVSSFFQTQVDWEKVKTNCSKFVAINSKDDPYVNFKNNELLKNKLNAQVVVHENMGHYNEGRDITEFPELLKIILEL